MTGEGFRPATMTGAIRVPGSKSLTIRALAIAALAEGRSHIYAPLDADDTRAMAGVLSAFGVAVGLSGDPWTVDGSGGGLNLPERTLEVSESGLTARIAIVMAAMVNGAVTIDGVGQLRERPMAPLFEALGRLGIEVDSTEGYLPVTVHGQGGLWGGDIEVDTAVSSQFVSSLLIPAPHSRNPTTVRVGSNPVSAGYIGLTTDLMRSFGAEVNETIGGYEVATGGYQPADIEIEVDLSAAVYPMVGAAITGGRVELVGVRSESRQPDLVVAHHLETMGCHLGEGTRGMIIEGSGTLAPIEVDMDDAPDGAMALAVACLFADGPSRITGLRTLRHKESDRLAAMKQGLERMGAVVETTEDSMTIRPGEFRGATIDPHGDHRVAMSLALAGLRIPDVLVADPGVVAKTWPEYWTDMRAIR